MQRELTTHPSRQNHLSIPLPVPLDIAQLFNPDANPEMWNDLVDDDDQSAPLPAYLVFPEVQQGILGWLSLQRCEEEQSRLLAETELLLQWIHNQIQQIKAAQALCTGMPYIIHTSDWFAAEQAIGRPSV